AECLYRWQPSYDRTALGHSLYANSQGDCDERRQAFWNHRHSNADDRLEEFNKFDAPYPLAVCEHQHPYDRNDSSDDIAELLDLAKEWGLKRADASEKLVYAPEFLL